MNAEPHGPTPRQHDSSQCGRRGPTASAPTTHVGHEAVALAHRLGGATRGSAYLNPISALNALCASSCFALPALAHGLAFASRAVLTE